MFQEKELSSSNIKKLLIFYYASENKNLEKKIPFISGNVKKAFYISQKKIKQIHPKNISYTSENGNQQKIFYVFSSESCSYILGSRNPKKIHYN